MRTFLGWAGQLSCLFLLCHMAHGGMGGKEVPAPPAIATLLKPNIYKKVTKERKIQTYASLDSIEGTSNPPLKRYHFYSVMLTRANPTRTRAVLTDYQLYSKLIPYIDETVYNPGTRILQLKGGIWKWKLFSVVKFEERSPRWIHFQVMGGHFTGLSGDLFFEPMQDQGTLVYMRGEQTGSHWPPAFIIERGAEIVFEFTASRMRSYLESKSKPDKLPGRQNDDHQVPQPRTHL